MHLVQVQRPQRREHLLQLVVQNARRLIAGDELHLRTDGCRDFGGEQLLDVLRCLAHHWAHHEHTSCSTTHSENPPLGIRVTHEVLGSLLLRLPVVPLALDSHRHANSGIHGEVHELSVLQALRHQLLLPRRHHGRIHDVLHQLEVHRGCLPREKKDDLAPGDEKVLHQVGGDGLGLAICPDHLSKEYSCEVMVVPDISNRPVEP